MRENANALAARVLGIAIIGCLAVVGLATPAQAQDEDQSFNAQEAKVVAKARRLYSEGVKHYRAAEYDEALLKFRGSVKLVRNPAALIYLAETADRLRFDTEAAAALAEYIELVPDTRKRAELEARIRVLEDDAWIETATRRLHERAQAMAADTPNRWRETRAKPRLSLIMY